jgi:Uma2 family endonuclease
MVAKPAGKRATYEDLQAVPSSMVAEILGGVLHVNPRPAAPHATASSVLGGELGPPFFHGRGGPGGWVILDEPELHLGADPDVVVPDLAGWRRARMPEIPDTAFFTLAPDWVCEVLSPSTEAVDRGEKLALYARERVGYAWLVDPLIRTLEVFRLDGGGWRLVGTWHGDAGVRAEPFDAIELPLAALWVR